MTPQQFVGLALRLFAIWLCITSIAYFTSIPNALRLSNSAGAVIVTYVIGAMMVLVAAGLWFFPMLCAKGLLPRTRHEDKLSPGTSELARVGCALMGLWLLSKSLPNLVWFVFRAFLITDGTSAFSALPIDARLDVLVSAFELVFAILLIAKAATFARLVAREGGAPVPEES